MKVRDLIARLSALRVAGLLDQWGEELVGTLERQAARGQGPTERQRFAAIALLKRFDPEIVAGALADHIATLTPEKVERIHRDARGREKTVREQSDDGLAATPHSARPVRVVGEGPTSRAAARAG